MRKTGLAEKNPKNRAQTVAEEKKAGTVYLDPQIGDEQEMFKMGYRKHIDPTEQNTHQWCALSVRPSATVFTPANFDLASTLANTEAGMGVST